MQSGAYSGLRVDSPLIRVYNEHVDMPANAVGPVLGAAGVQLPRDQASMSTTKFSHGYGLLIGVGQASYAQWSLPVTVKDARALYRILTSPDLCAYPEDQVHVLSDDQATARSILEELGWLQDQARQDPQATMVVYFSGHGWQDSGTNRFFLIPHDVAPYDVRGTALPAETFTNQIRMIAAQRLLVFIDTCHAAGMASSKDSPQTPLPPDLSQANLPVSLLDQLKQGAGRAVFTSSLGQQRSWVRPDGSLSIYTYHLLEALQGAGNRPGDTLVHVSNLMNHLGRTVPTSARDLCQAEQTPYFDAATEDFPVALITGGKGLPADGWAGVAQAARETIRQVARIGGSGAIAQGAGATAISIGGSVSAPIHTGTGDITTAN